MARIHTLSELSTAGGKAYLAEVYGAVADNLQKNLISAQLKNVNLSGDPEAGTVVVKRFANRSSDAYGTARSAGNGKYVTVGEVDVKIDNDRELITEVENKDVALGGVDNYIARQASMDEKSMGRELERAFFACAVDEGEVTSVVSETIAEQVEELIQKVETVNNDFVDGVERDMIKLILSPSTYGALRNNIDTLSAHNVTSDAEEIKVFHGCQVFSSVYLPASVKAIAMCEGSIAQPVMISPVEAGKIDLSDAYAFGNFFYFGTKAIMPDLIFALTDDASGLTVTSVEGTATGDTKITVSPTKAAATNKYYYVTDTEVSAPKAYSDIDTTAFTSWDGSADITATTGNEICIVETDADGVVLKAGIATVTAKA